MIRLNVPFREKDEAKQYGARWNAAEKYWFFPGDVLPEELMRLFTLSRHEFIDTESIRFPGKEKAIRDGRFITGKGLGAAVEFSYLIIESLLGKDKAEEVLERIQY